MGDQTDDRWLALLAARDPGAVGELRDRLYRGLSRAIAGRADHAAAEDFAQEATLRVLDRLAEFRGDCRFFTWAMAIAIRIAFSELRKVRYRDLSLDAADTSAKELPEPISNVVDVALVMDRKSALDILHQLIETRLTERQRSVIRAELDGIPQAVIADRLGTNRNALYKLSHDARMKLKTGLEAAGFTAEVVREMLGRASNEH